MANEPQINLADLIKELSKVGGVPITLSQVPPPKIDTGKLLSDKPRLTVAFPPCADELLSLIKTTGVADQNKDDITKDFDEYFKFGQHTTIEGDLKVHLDSNLLNCLRVPDIFLKKEKAAARRIRWLRRMAK